jgi:hypothetical protein
MTRSPRDGGVTVNWESTSPCNADVWTLDLATLVFAQWPATPGRFHRAELDDLPADRMFLYAARCDDGTWQTWSGPYLFKTMAPVGPALRVGIWGDNQIGASTFRRMVRAMVGEGCTQYLGLGDYIQNEGLYGDWQSQFFEHMGPVLRYLPVLGTRGNHDGEDALAKGLWPVVGNNQWGAVTWRNAHIVVLDSNAHFPIRYTLQRGGEQRAWLDQEMQSGAWRQADFRIVLFHHPHMTEQWDGGCYYGKNGRDPLLADLVDGSLLPGGASLILNGHAHSYQRGSWNQHQYHVISGGGGGYLDHPECWDVPHITVNPGRNAQFFHFLTMDIGLTDLTVRCVRLGNGEVFDSFTIPARRLD